MVKIEELVELRNREDLRQSTYKVLEGLIVAVHTSNKDEVDFLLKKAKEYLEYCNESLADYFVLSRIVQEEKDEDAEIGKVVNYWNKRIDDYERRKHRLEEEIRKNDCIVKSLILTRNSKVIDTLNELYEWRLVSDKSLVIILEVRTGLLLVKKLGEEEIYNVGSEDIVNSYGETFKDINRKYQLW